LKRNLLRLAIALGLVLPAVAVGGQAALADNASVNISDQGFDPPTVNVNKNGTVTFTNTGTHVHTASTKQGPVPFDTGGLGPNQAFPVNFTVPGTYVYTSNTDCTNSGGTRTAGFNCADAIVNVVDVNAAYNPNAFSTTPTPTPTPVVGLAQNVVIHITASGFTPSPAMIGLGGSVTFINDDQNNMHAAVTYGGGVPRPFDTGGLTPGLMASFAFTIPGTYTYTSSTYCLNGNKRPGFDCSLQQIIVSPSPSGSDALPAGAVIASQAATGTNITIDEANGYTPAMLVVNVGDTVTWTNGGKKLHTVQSDPGYIPAFDSGGINPGKSWSFKFPNPGTFAYHSTTDATYYIDGQGHQQPQWNMHGTIVVQGS